MAAVTDHLLGFETASVRLVAGTLEVVGRLLVSHLGASWHPTGLITHLTTRLHLRVPSLPNWPWVVLEVLLMLLGVA